MRGAYVWSAVVMVTVAGLLLVWLGREGYGGTTAWSPQRSLPLRIGYAIEAPFVMLDVEGRVGGESPEVLRRALQTAGIERAVWVHVEFGQLLHELETGRIDMIAAGMFITPERERRVLFSRPTVAVRTGVLQRAAAAPLPTLGAFAGQPDKRLAVIRGAVEGDRAREAGLTPEQILAYPDALSAIAAVRNRSADAFMLSAVSLRGLIRNDDDLVLRVPARDEQAGMPAYAFRLEDGVLRDRVDAALGAFLGSPAHRELVRPFGFDDADIDAALAWTRERTGEGGRAPR